MSFAADKLYNGYLRRNMPTIVSKVKVREIMIHLPCLTGHDRDTIEAKRETCGNYDGMVLLLDCLKRRENWPEQFIQALEACEQTTIAAEIKAEYNALKGVNHSNPGSPPATVVRAHVHPAPAASHQSVPDTSGNGQSAVAPAEAATTPPETPTQQRAPQDPEPESVLDPSAEIKVPSPPSTPPPSPEIPHAQVNDAQLPRNEITSNQEPEENSESDIQDFSGETSDKVSSGREEVAANIVTTPPQHHQAGDSGTDSPSHPEPLQIAGGTHGEPQRGPSPTQIISDVTDGSSFPTMTPEKHPVQDTTPPPPAAVPQPEVTSEPPTTQIVSEDAATTSSGPLLDGMDAFGDNADVCLSKPGQLLSVQPQNGTSPTVESSSAPPEPYSGNSQRLEISRDVQDTITPISTNILACSTVSSTVCSTIGSTVVNSVTPPLCQENGIAPNHSEPEENHYESPNQSLEVLENVVHVSEEPSILNLDGQTTSPQAEILNGETAKEIPSLQAATSNAVEDNLSSFNSPGKQSYGTSGTAQAHVSSKLNSEEKAAPQTLITQSDTTKYILTAAGVCACAMLAVWRLRK